MNANHFVAVGRIERLIRTSKGLTLVIGGAGPVKGLVAVELRDAALVTLVSNSTTGFTTGDLVSVSGRLELDVDTMQNVAVAAPDSVSRIARGAPARALTTPTTSSIPGATNQATNVPTCRDATLAADAVQPHTTVQQCAGVMAPLVTSTRPSIPDQGLVCLEDIEL